MNDKRTRDSLVGKTIKAVFFDDSSQYSERMILVFTDRTFANLASGLGGYGEYSWIETETGVLSEAEFDEMLTEAEIRGDLEEDRAEDQREQEELEEDRADALRAEAD